jgi:hypothetical protein
MNLLSHSLIATALIVGLILLRMFANRAALQARLRSNQNREECEQAGCFSGCDPDKAAACPDSGPEKNDVKRSA